MYSPPDYTITIQQASMDKYAGMSWTHQNMQDASKTMGFEEVPLGPPSIGHATIESEEEDLAFESEEVNRRNSFDFVIERSNELAADAEITELVQKSVLCEVTPRAVAPPLPPPVARRDFRANNYAEEYEMPEMEPRMAAKAQQELIAGRSPSPPAQDTISWTAGYIASWMKKFL